MVTKPYGAHTQQLLHKNDELGQNFVSGYKLLEQTLLNTCATCVHFDGPKNNPFICLGLEEKKAQTHNHGLESKQNWNSVFHKAQQIAFSRGAIEPRGWNSFLRSMDS